jgi:hypothetical protein
VSAPVAAVPRVAGVAVVPRAVLAVPGALLVTT